MRIPAGDNLPRAVCTACGAVHYENPRIVVGCVPEWQGQVLLCQRAIEPRRGYWTVPAGFMENGETMQQAAARECHEEALATELLAHWVRDHQVMSLEEAHWRLSAYPAMAVGLRDRGSIAEGMPADVIVYDLERLEALPQERLFDYPADEWRLVQKAAGYDRIIVNGKTTFIDGVCTDETPGICYADDEVCNSTSYSLNVGNGPDAGTGDDAGEQTVPVAPAGWPCTVTAQ